MKNPYSVLGVSAKASDADIKSAYRKLAKELHPDRNKDDQKVAERFKEVSAAYEFLKDKERRRQFDRGEIDADGRPTRPYGFDFADAAARGWRAGARRQGEQPTGDAADLFEELFGFSRGGGQFRRTEEARRGFKPQRRGRDAKYNLTVDFLDAVRGTTKTLELDSGKSVKVKIPPGVEDGKQIRLSGQGEPGMFGGPPGHALITVSVRRHPFFTRDGDDIRLELPITVTEAVLGGKVKVPTIDGPVALTIPKGSSGGTVLRLPKRGVKKRKGGRGDQLVVLHIVLPEDEDGELAEKIGAWSRSHGYDVRRKMGLD